MPHYFSVLLLYLFVPSCSASFSSNVHSYHVGLIGHLQITSPLVLQKKNNNKKQWTNKQETQWEHHYTVVSAFTILSWVNELKPWVWRLSFKLFLISHYIHVLFLPVLCSACDPALLTSLRCCGLYRSCYICDPPLNDPLISRVTGSSQQMDL